MVIITVILLILLSQKGVKNITLTLLQTAVLLLFNDTTKQSFSFAEIQAYTQLGKKKKPACAMIVP
jgi:hypothetical protein